jgi:ABC-type Co2+ transport system permease subunit
MRIVLVLVALLPASLGLAACGGAGKVSGVQAAWCAFHVWRLERDVRSHHLGWAAFNAALAVHHCRHVKR